MARAIAARRQGDEYQARIFWLHLLELRTGDFVKLSRNNERFWVQITGYVGRKWHGTVANKLANNQDIGYGDKIYFMKKNIYDTVKIKK